MPEYKVIGKPIIPPEAYLKATGQAQFTCDIKLPGMLWGKVLRSPLAHAKIHFIDTSKAAKMPGVKAVVTFKDTPGLPFGTGIIDDWTIFARDKVRFVGDEVAAVAAVDEDTATEALSLIRVEYEELPAVIDIEQALRPEAPLVHQHAPGNLANRFFVERGNIEQAFTKADFIVEDTFTTTQVYQAYLETMNAVAHAQNGKITLWASTQVPSKLRLTYAKALNIPMQDIRVIKPFVGGGFGAKFENMVDLAAMVLSEKSSRPVKIVNTREEDFIAGNPRVPMKIWVKLGLKKDGTILAKEVRIIAGNGARTVYGPPIMATACYRIDSLYRIHNIRTEGLLVYTNTVPTGCFRGFGNAQMTFALESLLDRAAYEMGLDPAEVRLINAVQSGDVSAHGWYISRSGLTDCIRKATEASDWEAKRLSPKEGKIKKGIGLACCNHVSGNRPFFRPFDGSAAIIRIGEDGKAFLIHGESDIGQGQNTVFAQIAAESLGIPFQDITVAEVDTQISPFGLGSFATRGTVMGGNGIIAACQQAKQMILNHAAAMLAKPADNLDIVEGKIIVKDTPDQHITVAEVTRNYMFSHGGAPMIAVGNYVPDTVLPDDKRYGNISPVYPFGCQIAEVEVNTETGQVQVTGFWAAHDVGRVINSLTLPGQVHGGVATGIGWALSENMIYDSNGHIQNPGFLDYRIPGSLDLPNQFHAIFIESDDPKGPFGAKGIGEPALNPTAAAVANAVYNAIGVRINQLPLTPEKILAALRGKND
ncbi:MAG: xanthine dehydrogenase family protein molybdopterin-binding subunit [Bacillota bacterium]